MVQKKILYSIAELSEMFDIPATTIRFWERSIAILNPQRINQKRRYTSKDIADFKIAYNLIRIKGLKVSAVNKFLASKPIEQENIRSEIIDKLELIKASLQQTLYYLNEEKPEVDDDDEIIIKLY